MQYCKRFLIVCCLLCFTVNVTAQSSLENADLTGLWKGTMYNDTTQRFLKYEIAISEKKGKLSGYSHTYFIVDDKEYHGVKKIKIKRQNDKVIVEDVELIANNYPIPPAKGVHQLDILTLEITDGLMVLSGPFSTNRTKIYHSLTGSINVQRKNNFWQSALIPHLEELGLASDLSFVQEEKTKVAEAIAKAKAVTEQPIVKAKPIIKETPVIAIEAKPIEKIATPSIVKKEEIKSLEKPAEVKPTPIVIAKPVVKEKPAIQTPVKTPERAIVKTTPPPLQKVEPTKVEIIEKPVETPIVKIVKTEPVKIINNANAATDIENRTIETIQSVNYKSDSLVLTLYDNGEVDGDTVSVLLNGEVIMPMVGLSTRAVRKTIYTKDLPDSIQIVMYAETLGSLPPNTGLLIVNDGNDRYEIRFSGDLKKNAAIVFKRKEN